MTYRIVGLSPGRGKKRGFSYTVPDNKVDAEVRKLKREKNHVSYVIKQ